MFSEYATLVLFCLLFGDRDLCRPDRPQILYSAEDGFELPPPP